MSSAIRAIVTGHSKGIGLALSQELRSRGIAVLGLSRSVAGEAAAPSGGAPLIEHAVDLSDAQALQAWIATPALAGFAEGAQQVLLVNNAGTAAPVAACGRQGAAAIASSVALNVTAPLMLTDALVVATSALADRRVLHLSSGAARNPYAGWSVYCATKAALDMHARAVREDAVPGLKIATLAPGVVDTAMQTAIRASDPSDFPQRPRFESLKREGQLAAPQAVAQRMAQWLLSDAFAEEAIVDLRTLVLPPA